MTEITLTLPTITPDDVLGYALLSLLTATLFCGYRVCIKEKGFYGVHMVLFGLAWPITVPISFIYIFIRFLFVRIEL